ncbi:murein biosynthesis integral membrane protein MurJ [bacterium]|nr:murein biosynthesis integral membrane protein MurJ [bacterium]
MSKSIYRKVGIASIIMMASVFLSRILGILREVVIAYLKGTDGSVDAYQISFIIPEILNHVLASGFLSITFIPIFAQYLTDDNEEEGWRVFSNILCCFSIIVFILIIIVLCLSNELISLTGITNTETLKNAIRMTRIIIPAQIFFFAGGLLMAVQFAKEQFIIPAMAPLLYNLCIILGGVILAPRLGMEGFSWGVLAGAFIGNFALQLWGAKRAGMRFSFVFNFKHPDLKKYILLTLPLMFGLTMTFSTEIFPKYFGSYLPEGSISSLNYGLRIMFLLVGFFGQAVGVASYPFMARLASENRISEMNRLLNTTLKYISLVIPVSVLMIILRHEIVLIFFQRGSFDAISTETTSNILAFLMIGAFAFTAQTIVTRGYYAMRNTLFPTIVVSIVVILSMPLYFIGMRLMGINGIALALSISVVFQVLLLYALWNRTSSNIESHQVYRVYSKIILLSLVMGLIFSGFKTYLLQWVDNSALFGSLLISAFISILFILTLVAAGYIFKIKEIFEFVDKLRKRVLPKK